MPSEAFDTVVCHECGHEHHESKIRCPECRAWDEEIHVHECGYCGREFAQRWDKVNDSGPCPTCRSRKKACDCDPEVVARGC